jgi:protein-tyrosine-phosphatase
MEERRPPWPSRRPLRLLFVCSGNTCRSPLAEAIGRRFAEESGLRDLEFQSAGTSALPGLPASDGALRAAHRHDLGLERHTSTPLSREIVEEADLILTMGPAHLDRVLELGGEGKSALLGAFALAPGDPHQSAVPDPFGGDDAVYEATFSTLEAMVSAALSRIAEGEEE